MTEPLTTRVELDPITAEVAQAFDCPFDGTSSFTPHPRPTVPEDWGIGVIVGGSGTGKSVLLRSFGTPVQLTWAPGRSIASHFPSAREAMLRLSAAGLSSIPDWCKPHQVLSTGQQFRADLARALQPGACIDEFTSTVDRDVAKAASVACARFVKNTGMRRLVFASCHRDIVPWLEPDWTFDTDTGIFDARGLVRPRIEVQLREGGKHLWPRFAPHHYLSGNCTGASRAFTLWWGDRLVGFCAVLPMPGRIHKAFRGHRTVVLPEFQGLGLGGRLVEAVGDILLTEGRRFFCRTAHPWVGQHRDRSTRWRKTTTSRVLRTRWKNRPADQPAWWGIDDTRLCWSHEYIGDTIMTPSSDTPKSNIKCKGEHDPRFPDVRERLPLLVLRSDYGDALVKRIQAGETVTQVAAMESLRRSSLYRLLKWKGLDTNGSAKV